MTINKEEAKTIFYIQVGRVVEFLINNDAKKATKYLSPTIVINATRKVYGGKINKRDKSIYVILKLGKPNFEERKFIKLCQKAKEPFPVKKIQLKFFKK